jgi:hypothetical protein
MSYSRQQVPTAKNAIAFFLPRGDLPFYRAAISAGMHIIATLTVHCCRVAHAISR